MALSNVYTAINKAVRASGGTWQTFSDNVQFDITTLNKYMQVFVLMNQPSVYELGKGGTDLMEGIAQIDIYTKTGTGVVETLKKVDELRSTFSAGAVFSDGGTLVHIYACGMDAVKSQENGFSRATVTVEWWCLLDRP